MSTSAKKPFYITTTLPYVNAEPHVGFAMEIIRADVIARLQRQAGHDVFFNTGTDEHGVKIYRKALEEKVTPQAYVDAYAAKFQELSTLLNLSEVHFIRTTDVHHVHAAQEFWKRCAAAGHIYKKQYTTLYCVGCELEKTASELDEQGRCPIHPTQPLERIDEENYFFRFSAFGDRLKALYTERPQLVVPDFRLNEMKAFVERGLEDFSISRLATKMPWGVPVPGDADHVMYVWFDALVSYISTIGWPDNAATFERFWNETGGVVQYCGKDNNRQQSAMWQAMLMAAGLSPSQTIVINGFITSGGQKMSKSLGNVIAPRTIVDQYGSDTLRYVVTRELHPFEDSDLTLERVREAYQSHLSNGLGNLASRTLTMAAQYEGVYTSPALEEGKRDATVLEAEKKVAQACAGYDLKTAMDEIWKVITAADQYIQRQQPFKVIKTDPAQAVRDVAYVVGMLSRIADLLLPFLPTTAEAIQGAIVARTAIKPLFPRIG